MSYELLDRPLVWIPVRWDGLVAGANDGLAKPVEHEIECLVEMMDKVQVRGIFHLDDKGQPTGEALDETATFRRLCSGWRKIMARGSPVPFDDANISKVVLLPNFMQGFNTAYFLAIGGVVKEREGNSEGSLSGGQAGAATDATNTDATAA